MEDGFEEFYDTEKTERPAGQAAATQRIKALYAIRGLESPAQRRAKTGELSPWQLQRQAAGFTVRGGGKRGRPTNAERGIGPDGMEAGGGAAGGGLPDGARIDQLVKDIGSAYAAAFRQIETLIILRQDEDPVQFRDHVRALVVNIRTGVGGRRRLI